MPLKIVNFRNCIVSRFPIETTGFWSADVYCQILNNQQHEELSYLYLNGKKGKRASCRRDRERECVCVRQRVAESRVGIRCKNGCWRATNYFIII